MQRTLSPLLKTFFDKELPVVGFDGKGVIALSDLIVFAGHSCLGVVEQGLDNHGPMVEAFQNTVGNAPGSAWCMDFVQSVVSYVEQARGLKSQLCASGSVLSVWNSSPNSMRVTSPAPGDIVLWELGTSNKGHCGILTGTGLDKWFTIEGNTSPSGIIEREGDGVYSKVRKRGGSNDFHELGFLRPFQS